jgi:hypothetical protein
MAFALMAFLYGAGRTDAASGAPGLAGRVSGATVLIEGVSPRKNVLLFGVSLERTRFQSTYVRWERVATDNDGDGVVEFALDRPVAHESIWAAIDLQTGDWVAIAPQGTAPRQAVIPREALIPGLQSEQTAAVDLQSEALFVVVVRGGAGAWGLDAFQDGRNDSDSHDPARLRVMLDGLRSLSGNAQPPKFLVPGDLFLAINPYHLEIRASRAGQ